MFYNMLLFEVVKIRGKIELSLAHSINRIAGHCHLS